MAGYTVKYGNYLLYEAGSDQYMIHDAQLGMRTDGVGTFTFTMVPNHPLRNHIRLRDLDESVMVYFDDQLLFDGFIVSFSETFNLELAVSCASQLQLLKDLHMRVEDHPRENDKRRVYKSSTLFSQCINAYNEIVGAQFEGARKFAIGHNLNASDASEVGYVDPSSNNVVVDGAASTPTPILDVITRNIVDPYGCMLRTRRRANDNVRIIDIYNAAPSTSGQAIRFGENLTKYAKVMSTENMYNACLPIGGSRREYNVTYAEWMTTTRVCAANTNYFWVRSIAGKTINAKKGDLLKMGDGEYQFAKDVDIPESGETQIFIEGKHQDEVHALYDGYWFERGTNYTTSALTLKKMADGFYDAQGNQLQDEDPNARFRKVGEVVYFRQGISGGEPVGDGVVGYGARSFTFSDSDVLTAQGLFRRAVSIMLQKIYPTVTLEVSGVDMALYMEGYTHLVAGQKVRVLSEPHNVDLTMQVTQATLSLDNPAATTYVIGPAPTTATKRIAQNAQDTTDVRDILTYAINDVITGAEILRLQ